MVCTDIVPSLYSGNHGDQVMYLCKKREVVCGHVLVLASGEVSQLLSLLVIRDKDRLIPHQLVEQIAVCVCVCVVCVCTQTVVKPSVH